MPAHLRLGAVDNAASKMKKISEYVDNGMTASMDVALDLEEVSPNHEHVSSLKESMVQYANMEREIEQWLLAVDQAKTKFAQEMNAATGDNIPNMEGIFKEQLRQIEQGNKDEQVMGHKKVTEFVQKVWNIHHEGESLPSQAIQGMEDEDLFVSQVPAVQTKCPLTQREMEKPMRNKKCGHNYDEEAILQHIANRRGRRAKCPVGGCPQEVGRNDLEHNTALQHHIDRRNRQK